MPRGISPRRHAQAIFAIAQEQGALDAWGQDLEAIARALGDPVVSQALESPRIPLAQKMDLVRRSLAGLNPLAINLAQLLVLKGRVGLAPDIAQEYRRLLEASRGIEWADVTTAIPLADDETARISHSLTQLRGREVRVSPRVDPAIVGGIVARIGVKLINGSVRSRLLGLKKVLVEGA
ncbi:MAG: ATP synthase F1 subunit delta [Chloroflexi bacterium]|nr:ATP synthase F1 subunit delta [Chloroflexota bacterium]